MLEPQNLEPSIRVLSQFFASATQHASVAMCQWTNGRVSLTLDEVREAPLEEVSAYLDMDGDLLTAVTMVIIEVQGDAGGQLILGFDDENGRKLAACLLNREPADSEQWSDLEKSALMETGNILGSAYLNELTRLTDCKLCPSAPYFVQDFAASVVEQAIVAQAMVRDNVLVCRTRFQFDKQHVNWSVFFVPEQPLLESIHEAVCWTN